MNNPPMLDSVGAQSSPALGRSVALHNPAKPLILYNSRLYCWFLMAIGVCAVFFAMCMVFVGVSEALPPHRHDFLNVLAVVQWIIGGISMSFICPAAWSWGRTLLFYRIRFDERGAAFRLGSRKNPEEVFMPWSEIVSIRQSKEGGSTAFTINAKDGSYAQFSSAAFLRPMHAAREIAERAGIAITKA